MCEMATPYTLVKVSTNVLLTTCYFWGKRQPINVQSLKLSAAVVFYTMVIYFYAGISLFNTACFTSAAACAKNADVILPFQFWVIPVEVFLLLWVHKFKFSLSV